MNSNTKYIANMLFGNVKGLKYTKKNLKYAFENFNNFGIMDTYLYGYKFIEVKNNLIHCNVWNSELNKWDTLKLTIDEFWNNTKHRKKHILLIEKR